MDFHKVVQFLTIALEMTGVKYSLLSKSVIQFTFQIIEGQMTTEPTVKRVDELVKKKVMCLNME